MSCFVQKFDLTVAVTRLGKHGSTNWIRNHGNLLKPCRAQVAGSPSHARLGILLLRYVRDVTRAISQPSQATSAEIQKLNVDAQHTLTKCFNCLHLPESSHREQITKPFGFIMRSIFSLLKTQLICSAFPRRNLVVGLRADPGKERASP